MAEHTKGKLKVDGNVYIKGEQGEMVAGTAHVAGLPVEEQKANAQELVRRWNEHDSLKAKADSQPALLAACENFREWWANHFEDFDKDSNGELLCLDNDFEAAIAAGKE